MIRGQGQRGKDKQGDTALHHMLCYVPPLAGADLTARAAMRKAWEGSWNWCCTRSL